MSEMTSLEVKRKDEIRMKAYQLKVQIKESHPPIWRRVIVPAGLSFSQLSVLLNEVMGWCGYHLSSFEFYHLGLRIEEEEQFEDFGFDEYDYLDAAETIIDLYLDSEDWFTYVYDFGDDWQHRVTVEKRLEEYDKNYAEVLKFKGETPYEDCGGIYGYYQLLKTLSNPEDPEYEEMKQWTEEHFTEKYDVKKVNELLKSQYLSDEESAPMMQNEIYEKMWEGDKPLRKIKGNTEKTEATENHEDEDFSVPGKFSDVEREMISFLKTLKKEAERLDSDMVDILDAEGLKDILRDYKKTELAEISKIHYLNGYSKYTKERLIDFLHKELLSKEVMRRYLEFASDKEIELLEGKENVISCNVEDDSYDYLLEGGYAGFCAGGVSSFIHVPEEVRKAYQKNVDREWKRQRDKSLRFLAYLNGAVQLYGVCPVEKALELYRRDTGEEKEYFDVFHFEIMVPLIRKEFVLKDDKLILKELTGDDKYPELLEAQGNKPFYEPSKREIEYLGKEGTLPFNKYQNLLKTYFINEDEEPEEAEELCKMIEYIIRTGGSMDNILDYLGWNFANFEDVADDMKNMNLLISRLQDVWNNTRMLINRGYTPTELAGISVQGPVGRKKEGKVITFPEKKKKKKVYPNDPCPCGSGKKYKNCCGKK